MASFISIFRRIIFGLTIIFLFAFFLALILKPVFSMEFRKSNYGFEVYSNLIYILPITILLTMTGTVNKNNSKEKNSGRTALTIFIAISTFFGLLAIPVLSSWNIWTNEAILYRSKKDRNITINKQIKDVGALGYDRNSGRVVALKPVLKYFYQITNVDTLKLNKNEWILVNEERDIHY